MKPPDLSRRYWHEETLQAFLSRIENQGCPDSRYGLVSWSIRPGDVFKLDQTVFALRRLSVGLDWKVGSVWPINGKMDDQGETYRKYLEDRPSYQHWDDFGFRILPMDTASIEAGISGIAASDAIYAWNFAFTKGKPDTDRPAPPGLGSQLGIMQNSFLHIICDQLSGGSGEEKEFFKQALRWITTQVQLRKKLREQLESLVE